MSTEFEACLRDAETIMLWNNLWSISLPSSRLPALNLAKKETSSNVSKTICGLRDNPKSNQKTKQIFRYSRNKNKGKLNIYSCKVFTGIDRLQQRCHMALLVSLFVTLRNLLFGDSAKENYYNLTKNNHKFQASVTERYTSLSKSSGIFRQNPLKAPVKKLKL